MDHLIRYILQLEFHQRPFQTLQFIRLNEFAEPLPIGYTCGEFMCRKRQTPARSAPHIVESNREPTDGVDERIVRKDRRTAMFQHQSQPIEMSSRTSDLTAREVEICKQKDSNDVGVVDSHILDRRLDQREGMVEMDVCSRCWAADNFVC